jgi:hypothetical protein
VSAVFLFSVAGFAASEITPTVDSISIDQSRLVIKLACTAHTDGTFDSKQILNSDLFGAGSYSPVEYQNMGYYLYEAWAINPGSAYPTVAAAVTITDANAIELLKAGEMALSTSASGKVEATFAKFRSVDKAMTIAIGDTGTAANGVTIYLKLVRSQTAK